MTPSQSPYYSFLPESFRLTVVMQASLKRSHMPLVPSILVDKFNTSPLHIFVPPALLSLSTGDYIR